jgi:hypothetical protein
LGSFRQKNQILGQHSTKPLQVISNCIKLPTVIWASVFLKKEARHMVELDPKLILA